MLIDLHIHEKTYSQDSQISLEEIIDQAREMGLDAVCITDHESNKLRKKAQALSQEKNFPVFVGAEVLTHEGDLLVYGLDRLPNQIMHAAELTAYVTEQGGAVISAHPYRNHNRSLGNQLKSLENLSGVEGLNGNTPTFFNLQAFDAAQAINKPVFGGSDAHQIHQVGKCATRFKQIISNEQELVQAILAGDGTPVYHAKGLYLDFKPQDHGFTKKAV